MSTNQSQDLVFFNDNSIVSNKILESSNSYLSIISHVQGTSPTWLINSILENVLVGSAGSINKDLSSRVLNRSEVYFISFLHPHDFYQRNCRKNGLDLSVQKNFHFVDCFSDLFTNTIKSTTNASSQISKLFEQIIKEITSEINTKKTIFIEWPEILLTSTDLECNELLFQINKINKLCCQLFIISPQDHPQIVNLNSTNSLDPSFKITDFLSKLYHRSQLNLHLQPLSTGRADDITGSLTISKGCVPYVQLDIKVIEKEYIYHITKESNIKLFLR